jgi:hypothetical protein
MKYVGNSSPCWTIKESKANLSNKAIEVLRNNRLYKEAVGPGKYKSDNDAIITKAQIVHRFQKASRLSIQESAQKLNSFEQSKMRKVTEKEIVTLNKLAERKNALSTSKPATHSFSTGQRNHLKANTLDTPAPDSYNVSIEAVKSSFPKYSLAYKFDENQAVNRSTSPLLGPGAYDPEHVIINKGVKFGKSERQNKHEKTDNLERAKPSKKRIIVRSKRVNSTFGKSSKSQAINTMLKNSTPGPGQYQITDFLSLRNSNQPKEQPTSSFVKIIKEKTSTPAPNAYQISMSLIEKSIGYKFGKANIKVQNDLSNHHSPTTSNINENEIISAPLIKIKGGDIGRGLRNVLFQSTVPGPTDYTPIVNLTLKRSPEAIINSKKSKRNIKVTDLEAETSKVISQVNYASVDRYSKARHFSKEQRLKPIKVDDSQSVLGQYDLETKFNTVGFKFGKEVKTQLKKEIKTELGPGFYDLKQTIPQIQPWIKLNLNKF